MIEKIGDMFTSDAPVLAHGVNCHGVMGAGVAYQFAKRWPKMVDDYRSICRDGLLMPGLIFSYYPADGPMIINMATQFYPGPDARIEWVEGAARRAARRASEEGYDRIAIPRIGCGIGGLDWYDVREVLHVVEEHFTITFEVWTLEDSQALEIESFVVNDEHDKAGI